MNMVLGWVKEWSFRNIKFHERGILSYIIQYKSPLNTVNFFKCAVILYIPDVRHYFSSICLPRKIREIATLSQAGFSRNTKLRKQ